MKILIAIPCMDTVPVGFAESILDLQKPKDTKVCFHPGSLIYDSRNLLALMAIRDGYDYVFWVDSDMILHPEALRTLVNDAEKFGLDMVTGIYFKRTYPTVPVLYDDIREPELIDGNPVRHIHEYETYVDVQSTLIPVAGCGFGCVLTRVSLLDRVWKTYGNAFLPFPWAGEDISFCHRVNLMKKQRIWCDTTVKCGHIGQYVYSERLFLKDRGNDE